MKHFLVVLLALVLLTVGWLYQAPRAAAKKLQAAALAGDTTALRTLVDFPTLRADLKSGFDQAVRSRLPTQPTEYQSTLAEGFTSVLADRLATPKGISFLFRNVSAHRALDEDSVITRVESMDYNTYLIMKTRGVPAHDSMFAVFSRQGLAWRMTKVWVSDLGRP